MAIYDSIDLQFDWSGDYAIGDDGDLLDTNKDLLDSLKNELHSCLRSQVGDWELHPNFATNLSEFRGEFNTRETADALKERIVSRIVASGLVYPEDLNVRIVPVAQFQVLVVITVNAVATPSNSLVVGQPLLISLLYDSLEDSVFFVERTKYEKEYIGDI